MAPGHDSLPRVSPPFQATWQYVLSRHPKRERIRTHLVQTRQLLHGVDGFGAASAGRIHGSGLARQPQQLSGSVSSVSLRANQHARNGLVRTPNSSFYDNRKWLFVWSQNVSRPYLAIWGSPVLIVSADLSVVVSSTLI